MNDDIQSLRRTVIKAVKEAYGIELRRLRETKGVTLSEVAKALGVGLPFVCNVEAGVSWLPEAKIPMMAKLLGVPPARLLSLRSESVCKSCNGSGYEPKKRAK